MKHKELFNEIQRKKSFLCVGLDPDIERMPPHLLAPGTNITDSLFEFNKAIINATHDLTIAYKPNLAFYECHGLEGWTALELTVRYIREICPEIFIIADAKRGDIGNTSKKYAQAFFSKLGIDAVTVAPYMGEDSVSPFLEYEGKWVVLLDLTSNKGSHDFQHIINKETGKKLYEEVLIKSQTWGSKENMMYVVGATQAEKLTEIRQLVSDHFLLVPGVGAQGGSLSEVAHYGMNSNCGLIVNSSREIIHAGTGEDFPQDARKVAIGKYQEPMERLLVEHNLL